jgi:hypothetical protein
VEPTPLKRDIISEYANYSSQVYAPVQVSGKHPDAVRNNFEITASDSKTIDGLSALERTLPRSLILTGPIRPETMLEKSRVAREEKEISAHLEEMENLIKTSKSIELNGKPPTPPPAWKRKIERIVRPPTPTISPTEDAMDEYTNSIILLQKLLRGRAVQNRMFEGKEKRKELIKELRIAEPLALAASELATADAAEESDRNQKETIQAAVEAVHLETISAMLDFLSKHMIRMKAERRIANLISKAENERRVREAAEGGRRQAESLLRAREENMFRQIVHTQQATVDSYLDSIITDAVDRSATAAARRDMHLKPVVAILPHTPEMEDADARDAMVVRQLVGSFLLPEVDRKRVQDEVSREEMRFLDAARTTLSTAEADAKNKLKK